MGSDVDHAFLGDGVSHSSCCLFSFLIPLLCTLLLYSMGSQESISDLAGV